MKDKVDHSGTYDAEQKHLTTKSRTFSLQRYTVLDKKVLSEMFDL